MKALLVDNSPATVDSHFSKGLPILLVPTRRRVGFHGREMTLIKQGSNRRTVSRHRRTTFLSR